MSTAPEILFSSLWAGMIAVTFTLPPLKCCIHSEYFKIRTLLKWDFLFKWKDLLNWDIIGNGRDTMAVKVRKMDEQGRIVIPKEWRDEHNERKFVIKMEDEEMKIIPLKSNDLTKYFDSIEVELESDLSDWHSVRKELRKG